MLWKLKWSQGARAAVIARMREKCARVANVCQGGMFPRVFGDEFGDKFGDEFGDKFSELPNLVLILVMNLVMNLVNCQIR